MAHRLQRLAAGTLFAHVLGVGVARASGGVITLPWWIVASGGGQSNNGRLTLTGTIGQSVVGRSSSGSYVLSAGFWSTSSSSVSLFGPRVYLPFVSVPPLIQNGGFDDGLSGWATGSTGGVTPPLPSYAIGNPAPSALLGDPSYPCDGGNGAVPHGNSFLYQDVTLPAGKQASVSFSFDMVTQDHGAHDDFAVFVNTLDSPANRIYYFEPDNKPPVSNCDPSNRKDFGWQPQTIALPAKYEGSKITLYFVNQTDSPVYNTWTYVDDVSINP